MVGRFFDDLTADSTPEESEVIFLRLREAITIVFPYLGMPTCIPACYGMIGVVERKGQAYASTKVFRKPTITEDDVRKGTELRAKIYSGVGNSDIFSLMDKYFTDLCKPDWPWLRCMSDILTTCVHSYNFDRRDLGLSHRKGQ